MGRDNTYYFEPLIKTNCAGIDVECTVKNVSYEWNVGPAGTSSNVGYAVKNPIDPLNKTKRLGVNVTRSGALEISVKITATCSDGTTCTSTATKTFNVTAPERYERGPSLKGNPTTFKLPCGPSCDKTYPDIVSLSDDPHGGTTYSFEPKINPLCSGALCAYQSLSYEWTIGPDGTAKYSMQAGTDKSKTLVVKVTKSGTLELSVTVTVKCDNGTVCLLTGSRIINVLAAPVIGPCTCSCKFGATRFNVCINTSKSPKQYEFTVNYAAACTGFACEYATIYYSWKIDPSSTAQYSILPGAENAGRFIVIGTKSGTLIITLTITVPCTDGARCSATTSQTFYVSWA